MAVLRRDRLSATGRNERLTKQIMAHLTGRRLGHVARTQISRGEGRPQATGGRRPAAGPTPSPIPRPHCPHRRGLRRAASAAGTYRPRRRVRFTMRAPPVAYGTDRTSEWPGMSSSRP